MGFFIGLDGSAKEVKDFYFGIDGEAHRVKTAFIGIDGKARVFYGGYYQPAVGETVLSLTTGEYYNEDKKFAPGRYEVQIAGTPYYSAQNCFVMTTTMTEVFKIVACCSNPVFARDTLGIRTGKATIFGGSGGLSAGMNAGQVQGTHLIHGSLTVGGSACHFMPLEGVFGADYLRCFHCGRDGLNAYGGCGAYGGGAGGRGSRSRNGATNTYTNRTGYTGDAGIGGAGGAGGTGTTSGSVGSGDAGNPGSAGSGIGAGTATHGGVAYYDGSSWSAPTRSENTSGVAYIIIRYLGK